MHKGCQKHILLTSLSDTPIQTHTPSFSQFTHMDTRHHPSCPLMFRLTHKRQKNILRKQQCKCHKWFPSGRYNIKQHACTLVVSLPLWIDAINEFFSHSHTRFSFVFVRLIKIIQKSFFTLKRPLVVQRYTEPGHVVLIWNCTWKPSCWCWRILGALPSCENLMYINFKARRIGSFTYTYFIIWPLHV